MSLVNRCSLIWLVLITFFNSPTRSLQPEYQVRILIKLHPKGPPVHLCNGAIIQSRLILTTASCVHYKFLPNSPSVTLHSSMLSIVAGTANDFGYEAISIKVSNITFHQDFNTETMTNDLAILHLEKSLPLDKREDMKWIIMDGLDKLPTGVEEPCLASFTEFDNDLQFIQFDEVHIMEVNQCKENSSNVDAVCSTFILPKDFPCDEFDSFLPYNSDRGTAIVCKDRLIGVLSSILPLDNAANEVDCSLKTVKAYYRDIRSHLDWLYGIVFEEESKAHATGNYMASMPFERISSAMMRTFSTETTPDTSQVKPTTATESTSRHSVLISSPELLEKNSASQLMLKISAFAISLLSLTILL